MVRDGRYIHCILYWALWGWKAFNYYLPLQLAQAHLIVVFYMALYPQQYDKSILADVHSSCTDSPWTFSKYPV